MSMHLAANRRKWREPIRGEDSQHATVSDEEYCKGMRVLYHSNHLLLDYEINAQTKPIHHSSGAFILNSMKKFDVYSFLNSSF